MGIDRTRFLTDVPAYLECPLCKQVLDVPTAVCEEEHVFCQSCLPPSVALAQECPSCEGGASNCTPRASKTLARILATGFEVSCAEKEGGCEWTGFLGNVSDHETTCQFREVDCTNADRGCDATILIKDLISHLESCQYDWIHCPRGGEACGPKYRRDDNAHHSECSQWRCNINTDCTTVGTLATIALHTPGCERMQKSIDRLAKQKYDLHRDVSRLEDELRVSQAKNATFARELKAARKAQAPNPPPKPTLPSMMIHPADPSVLTSVNRILPTKYWTDDSGGASRKRDRPTLAATSGTSKRHRPER